MSESRKVHWEMQVSLIAKGALPLEVLKISLVFQWVYLRESVTWVDHPAISSSGHKSHSVVHKQNRMGKRLSTKH